MITVKINNTKVKVIEGDTILATLERLSIDIPNLCSKHFDGKEDHCCRLCMVKVKKKDENAYSFKIACETKIENEMSIIASGDDELIDYRKSVLISMLHTHDSNCGSCHFIEKCKVKKYLDEYDINLKISQSSDYLVVDKKIDNMPEMLDADYKRCIDCNLCVDYQSIAIKQYRTMIMDICPTNVFFPKYFYTIFHKGETTLENGYCVYCSSVCECSYLLDQKNILSIFSKDLSKNYGVCDVGREMAHITKNNALDYVLKFGNYESLASAKKLYKEFFFLFDEDEALASFSLFYPIEDIEDCINEANRLGIKMFGYRTPKISTNTMAKNENMSNYKVLESLGLENKYAIDFNNISPSIKLFLIVSDYFLESDPLFIKFCKENQGKYIIFTPYNNIPAHNAYLAFPLALFGEFSGEYIDKYGNKKNVESYFYPSKDRMSIKKILEYLYS